MVLLMKQLSGGQAPTPPTQGPHRPSSLQVSVPSKQPGVLRYEGSPRKHQCTAPGVQGQPSSTSPLQLSSSPVCAGSQSSVGPHCEPQGLTMGSSDASE